MQLSKVFKGCQFICTPYLNIDIQMQPPNCSRCLLCLHAKSSVTYHMKALKCIIFSNMCTFMYMYIYVVEKHILMGAKLVYFVS